MWCITWRSLASTARPLKETPPWPRAETIALLTRYYAAFNAGDWQAMLDCLADDCRA